MRITFILLFLSSYLTATAQLPQWFRDDFNSNTNNWYLSETSEMDYIIKDGHYILSNKNDKGIIYWGFKNIYMNPKKDFSMEVKMKITASTGNNIAGFFITDKDGKMNFFGINPYNNSFWVGYYNAAKAWGSYTSSDLGAANSGWQKTNAYKSISDYQILTLSKKGDNIIFYINNQKVLSLASTVFCSNINKYIGFITATKMDVYIDYVVFNQDNKDDVMAPDALPIKATALPTTINTYADELNPVLSPDKKTLYFTRVDHKNNYPGVMINGTMYNGDIYYSEYINDTWTEAKRLEYGISNNGNNSLASVSPDGNTILLFGTYDQKKNSCDHMNGVAISNRTATGWSYPENLIIKNFYTLPCAVNYYLADNGRTLILCNNRNDTKGDGDMYVSFKQDDNTWSEPKHMGATINSYTHEFSPFISADNTTLYFASWMLPNYGEADMYMTKRLDDSWTKWSKPLNMGPAINDQGFNAYYKISADAKVVYFSSNSNSIGRSDIFMSDLPKELSPEPITLIKGRVLDAKTKLPVAAHIRYENLEDRTTVGDCRSTPKDGSYSMILPYGKNYGFYAQADGYIAVNENMDLKEISTYNEIEKDIYLVPIELGQSINLNNVFFVRSKPELLPTSYPELDRLATLLKENPSIEIEIRGHTDNQGDPKLNEVLSEERVKTVTDYLVKAGIDKSRIKGKGFGGAQPISPNDTEKNREKNRRVEFVITKK